MSKKRARSFAGAVDPLVGLEDPIAEGNAGNPTQLSDSIGSEVAGLDPDGALDMSDADTLPGDGCDGLDQLVDEDVFVSSDVDPVFEIGLHQEPDAVEPVVDGFRSTPRTR